MQAGRPGRGEGVQRGLTYVADFTAWAWILHAGWSLGGRSLRRTTGHIQPGCGRHGDGDWTPSTTGSWLSGRRGWRDEACHRDNAAGEWPSWARHKQPAQTPRWKTASTTSFSSQDWRGLRDAGRDSREPRSDCSIVCWAAQRPSGDGQSVTAGPPAAGT